LLLPALSKAQDRAKRTNCLSNLRQIGLAMQFYLTDNEDRYPTAPGLTWHNLLGTSGRPSAHAGGSTPQDRRLLNPYLAEVVRIAECPGDRGDRRYEQGLGWPEDAGNNYEFYGTSYNYFIRNNLNELQARDSIWSIEGHHVSEVRFPDRKVVVADTVIFNNRPTIHPQNQWHSAKDPMQVVAAFADGHSEMITKKPPPLVAQDQYPGNITQRLLERIERDDYY
jgi:hypothetical protein